MMRSFSSKALMICSVLAIGLLLAGGTGCRKANDNDSEAAVNDESDQLENATDLWDSIVANYRAADSYRDDAKLNLSYRLAGKWVEEYHPQSVIFEKGGGRGNWSCKLFHARVRVDSKRMTCFVYDLQTGNLDDQVWVRQVTAGSPSVWSSLCQDPIAHHFVSGRSELPLNESKASTFPLIFSPVIELFDGSVSRRFTEPSAVKLKSENENAWVFELSTDGLVHEVTVDKSTRLLTRLKYDHSVLDDVLEKSDEVTDLNLTVEFGSPQIGKSIDPQLFTTHLARRARPVTHFVKIPEAFPSDLIGQRLPDFQLQSDSSAVIESRLLKGQTTALLLADSSMLRVDSVNQFIAAAEKTWDAKTRVSVVFCGDKEFGNGAAKKFGKLTRKVSFFFDPQYQVCKSLDVKQLPSVVVIDEQLKVHYFKSINHEPWEKELVSAVNRIKNGDDVASEMLDDYEKFLEQYHAQLIKENPFETRQTPVKLASQIRVNPKYQVTTLWERNLQKPGRIITSLRHGESALTVVNGFQNIVRLDPKTGEVVSDIALELPQGVGVSEVRNFFNKNGKEWFAAFSPGSKQVFAFDEQGQLLFGFPEKSKGDNFVHDVELADLDGDGNGEMYVSIGGKGNLAGLVRVELRTGNVFAKNKKIEIKDFAIVRLKDGTGLIATVIPGVASVLLNSDLKKIAQSKVNALGQCRIFSVGNNGRWISTLSGRRDQMRLYEFDTAAKQIRSNKLERISENICFCDELFLQGTRHLAISDQSARLTLHSFSGVESPFSILQTNQKINDLKFVDLDGKPIAIVSHGNKISAVQINSLTESK